MNILMNHIGYEPCGIKIALLQTETEICPAEELQAKIIDAENGRIAWTSLCSDSGAVDGWKNRYFYRFDFSSLRKPGTYTIRIACRSETMNSQPFEIRERLIADTCVSDIVFYYKSQRCSGLWDRADQSVPFWGDRHDRVDVHGGWYDAAGDYSKYLSHLSYANFFNPQQVPLVIWSLCETGEQLESVEPYRGRLLPHRTLEEAFWGADFLMRMQDPAGYFYTTVFDQWSKMPGERMICSFKTKQGHRLTDYQAGFRQGGGMAIAALARASRVTSCPETHGEYTADEYRLAAIRAYDHLKRHNTEYLDNGRENIIDYYCALMAAVELFMTASDDSYLHDARDRADQLMALFSPWKGHWIVEEDSSRPFFHASDEGLPLVALVKYCNVEPDADLRKAAVEFTGEVCSAILLNTDNAYNPFNLARRWVQSAGSSPAAEIRTSFFIPHENETGYWWQGENANLASLAAAFRMAAQLFRRENISNEADVLDAMRSFADSQLNWILGMNPFDICMLQGRGRNNPKYEEFYPNAPGGICNGITAGFLDESDIDFLPETIQWRGDHRWRWSEQWIPHAAWFLLASAADMQPLKSIGD